MPRLDHVIRNKLRDSQRWWLYWLEIFSKEERQFLLLLCEKHASFVWCSEDEDTLNMCVDVRFCEHERLSIRRCNCDQLPHIEMDCLYVFEPQTLCLLPLMTQLRACLNWWWRWNPRSTFIYVAVNLIDLKTKHFLRSPWSRAKRIGSLGFLIFFFFILVRVNACGDKLR